jgi:pyruvate/2-oxoglutarate/acetoin dehydrogenase E1 component
MRNSTVSEIIRSTLIKCMKKDKKIILFGEGIDDAAAMFGTTKGLTKIFGKNRVFEMPLSENCIVGAAIGASLLGDKVIVNFQRVEFALLALEQIINNAAKTHYITNGKHNVPIVIRLVVGRGWGQGPSHSQSLESIFALIPGLKVFMPVFPDETKNLLYEAINDPNPVIFIENRWIHYNYGKITNKIIKNNPSCVNLNQGKDLTIVSSGYSSVETLSLVKFLKKNKINIDFFHLRKFKPLNNIQTIINSVKKTRKIILIDNGNVAFGIMAEILRQIIEKFNKFEKNPIVLGLKDHPIPSSKSYIENVYVNNEKVLKKITTILNIENKFNGLLKRYNFLNKNVENLDTPNPKFKGPF